MAKSSLQFIKNIENHRTLIPDNVDVNIPANGDVHVLRYGSNPDEIADKITDEVVRGVVYCGSHERAYEPAHWFSGGIVNNPLSDSYANLFSRPVFGRLPTTFYSQNLTSEQQETCHKDIYALLDTAGKQNWDGEGADPVTEDTVTVAARIVKELPSNVGIPEISADPEGSVEFDWYLDNGTMFTISIGKTGDIAISGLCNGEAKLTGMQWDRTGKIDLLLQCGLKWLGEMQKNDNRKQW